MKLNSTVAFTLILLARINVGAGTVSALWGYTLGYGALNISHREKIIWR